MGRNHRFFRISFLSLLKNCNHKRLGIYYLLSSFIFGISGTLVSVLMRIELHSSGNRIISPENQNFYNVSISLHGLLMIFFLVMPGLFGGFGNYLLVIFQGSPEVVYPRVNNFSFLSSPNPFFNLSFWRWNRMDIISTIKHFFHEFITFKYSFTCLNFWVTILNLRSYCLTLKTVPLFPGDLFITAAMLLLTLPILSGAFFLVLADLHSNTLF